MHSANQSENPPRPGPKVAVIALLIVATFVLGIRGAHLYEASAGGEHADLWSDLYHTLQLFILHAPHLEGSVPLELHLARFLGAGIALLGVYAILASLFREFWLLLNLALPRSPGHVIVCGLGELGQRLALDGAGRGRTVVAIEQRCPQSLRRKMNGSGVLVIEGDAAEPRLLRKAQIARADQLVIVGPDDATNVGIAAAAARMEQRRRKRPLMCRLLISDPDNRAALDTHSFLHSRPATLRVNLRDLDRAALAARKALTSHALDFEPIRAGDLVRARLVIVGFAATGQAMALQAARIAHFANERGTALKTRITVIDAELEGRLSSFRQHHPYYDEVCEFESAAAAAESDLAAQIVTTCREAKDGVRELVTVVICTSDAAGFRLGTELEPLLHDDGAQILVHQSVTRGFADLLGSGGFGTSVHAFGMNEGLYSWDEILDESADQLARTLHEGYRAARASEGEPPAATPEWSLLSDDLRDSNRSAADHIPVKLRAIGCIDHPLTWPAAPVRVFGEEETLLLAQMEHSRWCAERRLANWVYGPESDRERRINRFLVGWDDLDERDRLKDVEQIREIPAALRSIGRGVYRK